MERAAHSGKHRRMYQLVKQLSSQCAAGTSFVKGEDGTPLKTDRRWSHGGGEVTVKSRLIEQSATTEEVTPNWAYRRVPGTFWRSSHQVGGGESDSDVEEQQGPWDWWNCRWSDQAGSSWAISTPHQLFVKIWEDETVPDDWTESLVCTIFKKGDRSMCSNYRGISLLSVPGKVFGLIILERIRAGIEGSSVRTKGASGVGEGV